LNLLDKLNEDKKRTYVDEFSDLHFVFLRVEFELYRDSIDRFRFVLKIDRFLLVNEPLFY